MPKITKKRFVKKSITEGYISRDRNIKHIFFSKGMPEYDANFGTYYYPGIQPVKSSDFLSLPVVLDSEDYASIKITVECIVYDKDGKLKK